MKDEQNSAAQACGSSPRSLGRRLAPVAALLRARRLLVLPAMLLGFAAANASAAGTFRCSQLGSFSARNPPAACWRPYGSTSPFNAPIPANAKVASDSSEITRHLAKYDWQFEGGARSFSFDSGGDRPVYYAAPTDPLVHIHCTGSLGPGTCHGSLEQPSIAGITIHIPAGSQPQNAHDGHMTVIDQQKGIEYDFWQAKWIDSTDLQASSGSQIPIDNKTSTGRYGEADAANFGLMAGVLRPEEVAAHQINHALVIIVPCTTGYVYPALGPYGDGCTPQGQSTNDAPHIGTLFQLNMSEREIAASRPPRWERAIMTAMARYGLYVVDTNGNSDPTTIYLGDQGPESWTSFGLPNEWAGLIKSLGGWGSGNNWVVDGVAIPRSKLRVIDSCAPRGTCRAAVRRPTRHHRPRHARHRRRRAVRR